MGGTRSQASNERRTGGRARSWWVLALCLLILGAGGASASVTEAEAQGINAAPVAKDNEYRVKKGNTLKVQAPGVLKNDLDPDGDQLSAARASSPRHGKLSLKGGGSFVYTPDKGYRGKDSFAYRASDGMGGTDTATVEITVWSPDPLPLARNNTYTIAEDGTLTVPAAGVLKNDAPAGGRRLSATKVTDPGHGSLTLNRNGSFVYTPDADFSGEDSFVYRARDGRGRTDNGTVRISVGAINDAPAFTGAPGNTSQTIDEGAGLAALEATDADGDTLAFEITNGSLPPGLTLDADGGFAGVAGGRAVGSYTANIRVSDGNGETATTALAVTVNAVEEAAVVEDLDVTTDEDVAKEITLSATDADTDNLTFAVGSPGDGSLGTPSAPNCATSAGTATCTTTVLYTPDADFNGPDSFTYTAGDSEPATVDITVSPVNDEPEARADDKTTPENTPLVFPASDLLANDSTGAANENAQTLSVEEVKNPQNGTVVLDSGEITFTPQADYNGPASFDYTVCDSGQACSTQAATVSVTVSPVNSRPVAQNGTESMDEDANPIQIDLGALVSDVETSDANLAYAIVSGPTPQQGTLTGSGPTFTFDSADDFDGEVGISYKATDRGDPDGCAAPGAGCAAARESETGTVTVTVDPANDAPRNVSLSNSSVDENEPSGTPVGTLSSTDPDAGETFTYALVAGAGSDDNGQFQISNDRLEIAAQFDRETKSSYAIRVRSTDSANESFEKQFTITVDDVNEAPTDISLSSSNVDENEPLGTDVGTLATTDPDAGDTFTYALVAGTGSGDNDKFAVSGDKLQTAVRFDHEAKSDYTVRVRSTDGGDHATGKALAITVDDANDAPTATDDTGTTDEDTPLNVSAPGVLGNDTDEDAGDTRTVGKLNGSDTLTGTSAKGATVTINANGSYTYDPGSVFQQLRAGQSDTDTFTYKAKDGGGLESGAATVTITITGITEPPSITSGGTLAYTENDPATPVDGGLGLTHPDGAQISEATVEFPANTGNYQSGEDVLEFGDDAGDGITLDPGSTGQTITLTGDDSAANYQAALRDVTYKNTSENPSSLTRTVTFTATDANSIPSTPATREISVTPVDDPPVAVNDSATVLEDASATDVPVLTNDTDVDGGPKTISSPSDPANGTVAVTGGGTGLTYRPDANYCNDPPATNLDTFTYDLNGGSRGAVSMTVTCVNDAPVADNESFSGADRAIGNTSLVGNDPTDGAPDPNGPQKTITGDILDGDTDIDGPGTLAITGVGTNGTNGQTTGGGQVTVQPDGDFIYQPEPGCADTTDTFEYTVSDGYSPTPGTDQGTVTVNIAECVWYVDDDAPAGGDGRSHSHFNSFASINSATGAGDADDPNDDVFLYPGSYSGGLPLENGQNLQSKRHGLQYSDGGTGTTTLEAADAAGAHSTLSGGLVLGQDNFVQGVDLGSHTGFALSNASAASVTSIGGTAQVNNLTSGAINNPSGGGVNVANGGNINFRFQDGFTTGGGTHGINLAGSPTGTFNSDGTGTISGATTTDVVLNGGGVNFTLNSTVSDDSGQLVSISNQTGGTKDFNGPVNDVTTSPNNGGGISLSGNTNTTTRFDGGLNLSTGTSNGLVATNGGTLALPDPAGTPTNSIASTTGTPLNVASTTIHADDLVFEKISSNGSANGIVLNNTGTGGNLSVTGNGGVCTIATPMCSGGTIQNTTGDGVSLTNTNNPSFANVQVKDTGRHGISGTTTSNLALSNSLVLGAGDADNEAGLFFATVNATNLTGNSSITNTVVHQPAEVAAFIQNYGGALNLTVSGSTFSGTARPSGQPGEDLLRMIADRTSAGSATITTKITGSTFKDSGSDDITAVAQSSTNEGGGTMNLTVDGNTFVEGNGVFETCDAVGCNSNAILVHGVQASTIRYTVQNNTIRNHLDAGVVARSDNSANVQGVIQNNTIGQAGVARSGSYRDRGILLISDDNSDHIVRVENNVIHSTHFHGIYASAADGTNLVPEIDLTILGNTTPTPSDTGYLPSIGVDITDRANACARTENNTAAAGKGSSGSIDFLLYHDDAASTATFKLEGLATSTADASAFLKSKNPASANPVYAFASQASGASAATFTGGTCRTPAATPAP